MITCECQGDESCSACYEPYGCGTCGEADCDCEPFDPREADDDRSEFADPGGRSALRAATDDNPRDQPCPTCGEQDVLTRKDTELGYCCDFCAERTA